MKPVLIYFVLIMKIYWVKYWKTALGTELYSTHKTGMSLLQISEK